MSPCNACPVPLGLTCIAITTGHAHLCQVDPSDPWMKAGIVAASGGPPLESVNEVPESPDLIQLHVRIDACHFMQGCQCNGSWRCLQAGEAAIVTIDDCRGCPETA